MKIEEVIGRNVLRIRERRSLSQADLGAAVGQHLGKPWSRQAVSAAEKGRRSFTAADLMALARVLNVSMPEFFLLVDWRDSQSVELSDGVVIGAEEYAQRILHDSDARGFVQLMAQADVQELGEAVIRLRDAQGRLNRALNGLESDVISAGTAVKLISELDAERLKAKADQLKEE